MVYSFALYVLGEPDWALGYAKVRFPASEQFSRERLGAYPELIEGWVHEIVKLLGMSTR
jgi:hypothetical protein